MTDSLKYTPSQDFLDQLELYKAKITLYKAQVDRYMAEVDGRAYTVANFVNQPAGNTMSDGLVFSVFTAANGFYAKMPDGRLVVGMTLSEVCTAAQAAAAEAAITADVANERGDWNREAAAVGRAVWEYVR